MSQMPIYYINLARATGRRGFMEEQFHRLGLAATRVQAVTTDELTPDDLRRFGDPRRYRWLTPVELACAYSHRRVMKLVAEGEALHALVLEDDAVLSPALPGFLGAFAAAAPAFDLVKLETFNDPIWLAPRPDAAIGGIAFYRPFGPSAGTAGYIVGRAAAARILAHHDLGRLAADDALFNPYRPLAARLSIRQADPALCVQSDRLAGHLGRDLDSTIVPYRALREAQERTYFWRRLPRRVRLIADRDLRVGTLKTWNRVRHRATKRLVRMGMEAAPPDRRISEDQA